MTVRISELVQLSADLSQSDVLPIVDLSAGETKQISVGSLLTYGISGAPSYFIDLSKLNPNSATKLSSSALTNTGVASGIYGNAATVARFAVNSQGLITTATGVPILIAASNVTGLAAVASSGTYASLTGLPTLGTLASQNAGSVVISGGTINGVTFVSGAVTISGGTISGITDLAIADGGTGASTAANARVNLGLNIGSNVQAYSSSLGQLATAFDTSNVFAYSSASGVIATGPVGATGLAVLSGSSASGIRSTIGLGSIAVQNANSVNISGGAISGVTLASSAVSIAGGTISGITDLAISDGGTGASTASGARTNLGLTIGSNVQAYSSSLNQLSTAFNTSNVFVYSSASGVVATGAVGTTGLAVLSGASASGIRSTIGLGSIAVQNANSVNISGGAISGTTLTSNAVDISGGTISGITDLAIADGGTGSSTAAGARANLGLAIGSNVQGYSPVLASISTQFNASDTIIYASESGVVSSTSFTSFGRSIVSGSTASQVRSTLGLGSIASQNAGSVAISGGTISGITFSANNVTISGGTIVAIADLAIADGGTGASTASDARTNLGLAIGTHVQAYSSNLSQVAGAFDAANVFAYSSASGVIATGSVGTTGLAVISGASASDIRSTIGLGTIAVQNANSVNISGGTINGATLTSSSVNISGGTISGITDLAISDGGTGASTASDARTNLGLAIGTNVQAYSAVLSSVASQFNEADRIIYASASGVVSTTNFTSLARSIVSGSTASQVRSTIGLGTISTQDAGSVSISGGTVSNVTLGANNVTISGGTITAITDLAVTDGGTGASTASGARTNLGLAIGTNVQAYSSALSNIATAASGTDLFFHTTASGAIASSPFSNAARSVVAPVTISGMRNALGLGSVALLNAISIGSGDISNNAVTTNAILDGSIVSSKIATNAISYSKLAKTSQSDVLLGRATASGGDVEEIPCTAAARSILDDASIADIRNTLGLGTLALGNGSFTGTSTGTNTGDQTIVLTGDVTGTGTGTFEATIANSAIVEAKVASNAITTVKVASGAITAAKLADQSASVVSASSPSASGAFIGQQWVNTNNALEYTWTGTEWLQQSALGTVVASGDSVYSFATIYPDEYSAVITASLNTQGANIVFAGPGSGSNAAPSFRALIGSDLPNATSSTKGAVIAGAGLAMDGSILNHSNAVASGVYYKVQVDGQGHVSSGAAALAVEDIPSLDASKITTGTFGNALIGADAVLAPNLGNYSTTQFGETLPVADFIGQYFFNPLSKDLYLWDGNVWNPVGISIGEIVFAGTYNASGNTVASVTGEGSAIGLSIGQPLPAASVSFNKYYVVVASGGTGTSPAPTDVLQPPDIILCNGTAWNHIDVSSTYVAQTASQVSFTPGGSIGSTNVQAALEEVNNECRNLNNVASGILSPAYGGTGFASYTKGDLLAASGTAGFTKLTVGANGRVLTANSATTTGLEWLVPASGTVLSVNATAPLAVVSGTTTPHITISGATTSAVGVVQLSDSISTTSSVLAATATAVKSAYDLANAALPKAGGTLTGNLELGANVTIVFEGSSNDAFETTLTVANPTADNTITLPNISGTVITNADTGTVTNAMLAGSIADTKLSTISTAGKVSNSATTATSANTVNAIVARDASGNFSAGTINATIDDGTY
jgi:hypothetical protein